MRAATLSLFDAPATLPSPAPVRPTATQSDCPWCGWPGNPCEATTSCICERFATAPHNHTETSKAAAAHVLATGQAATQLAQVLSLIEQAGKEGTTRGDIAHALGLPQSTIAARVDTLRKAGRVQEDGRTRIPKCGGAVRQKVIVGVGK